MTDQEDLPSELLSNPDHLSEDLQQQNNFVPHHDLEALKQIDFIICGDLEAKLFRLDMLANECQESGQFEEVVDLRIQ
jgi:hypothetical protein